MQQTQFCESVGHCFEVVGLKGKSIQCVCHPLTIGCMVKTIGFKFFFIRSLV